MSLTLSKAPLVLGASLVLTSLFGFLACAHGARNVDSPLLVIFNWILVATSTLARDTRELEFAQLSFLTFATAVYTIVVGTLVWFATLRERQEFSEAWKKLSPATVTLIQEKVWASEVDSFTLAACPTT